MQGLRMTVVFVCLLFCCLGFIFFFSLGLCIRLSLCDLSLQSKLMY